jgi:hypothetical protein
MTIAEILRDNGIDAVNEIRANLGCTGTNATVKTSQSLAFEVAQLGTRWKLIITGRPYFMTVETGRKPTPGKKPSRQMISNIAAWLNARGLNDVSPWAVAMTIQRKGTELWLKGGRTDIVSNVLNDEFYTKIGDEILANYGKIYLDRITEDFKNLKNVTVS